MISSIEFSNYRAFNEHQRIELAPITIVFGKNNVGKSAVLKLPSLVQSALHCQRQEVTERSYLGVTICRDYRDLVYKRGTKQVNVVVETSENDSLEVEFFYEINPESPICTKIDRWTLTDKDGNKKEIKCDDGQSDVVFHGFMPQMPMEEWMTRCLVRFNTEIDYVGPVRALPNRDFRPQSIKPDRVGVDGRLAYDCIINDVDTNDGRMLSSVSKWYEDTFDGWSLNVDTNDHKVYQFELRNKGLRSNILDTGFGILQSLPVMVAASLKDREPRLVVFEEPETHLHPAAHGDMGQFIAERCIDLGNRYLIETHSLNFITRIRSLVAEGILDRSQVALYYVYFDSKDNSSRIDRIELSGDGTVKGWPDGVFNESLKESIRLRDAKIKNTR